MAAAKAGAKPPPWLKPGLGHLHLPWPKLGVGSGYSPACYLKVHARIIPSSGRIIHSIVVTQYKVPSYYQYIHDSLGEPVMGYNDRIRYYLDNGLDFGTLLDTNLGFYPNCYICYQC